MLHLAQVNKNPISGKIELQLLAHETPEQVWEMGDSSSIIFTSNNQNFLAEGLLVLVELTAHQEIIKIESAKDWILCLIEKYLKEHQLTPEMIKNEQARIEQWRQEITAQSLDLTRRNLEIETRRDQLQELEISLKQEKEKLENRWQQLQKFQEEMQKEKEELKKCCQNNQEES